MVVQSAEERRVVESPSGEKSHPQITAIPQFGGVAEERAEATQTTGCDPAGGRASLPHRTTR